MPGFPQDRTQHPFGSEAPTSPNPPTAPTQMVGVGAATDLELPGDTIGPFTILSVLGEGGFGVVYLAERREPMVQRVAIKVIKPGMDSRTVVARFDQERQALAVMDHPGIAKVFDAGMTTKGRPYFAMEYVQGEAITEYCDRRLLSTRERLALFAGVCEAVQHAHMRGIIHRDLKPSNVLVTTGQGPGERPIAKVIDFGIAKAIGKATSAQEAFTEHGQWIGTPEYMSPEQAGGKAQADIDTRTDVYSLGVLLYELLAGTLPFDSSTLRSAGYAEIQRIIREVDPPRPSTKLSDLGISALELAKEIARRRQMAPDEMRRELHRELEWIPLRAMRKDREERYQSPADLAQDITNYLEGRPLLAGPESRAYRIAKFVKRRRGLVIAASLVLAGLTAGVVGVGVGYVRATNAAESERLAREGESSQRTRAEATTNFLHDMLASIDPEKSKGREVTVREMLDQAAAKVGDSLKDDPVAEASLRSTLAQTYHQLSFFSQAAEQNAKAAEIDERVLGKDNKETLTVKHNLAASWLMLEKIDQARELLDTVYEARVRTLGERSEDALATLGLQGFAAQASGDLEGALKVYRKTYDAQKASLAGGRKARGSMETLASIADTLNGLGRLDEAEKSAAELVSDATTATPENGGGVDGKLTLMGLSIRASILKELGRLEESERIARETLAAKRRIYGPEHSETLTTQNALAQTLDQLKKYDEAATLTREAMEIAERSRGEIHDTTLSYMSNLARIEQLRGNLDEAERLMRRSLSLRERVSGPDAVSTLTVMNNLGLLLLDRKKPAEAEPVFRTMLAGVEKAMPEGHWIRGQAKVNVGECLLDQSKYEEAEPFFLSGFERLAKSLPPGHGRLKTAKEGIVKLYTAWGKADKAAEWNAKVP